MSTSVSPSEIALLRGTDFAPPGHLGFGEHVPGTDAKVSLHDWMHAVWLVATAAVVAAGDVRLTPTATKHLFGLLTSRSVRAERGSGPGAWPADSLEAQLVSFIGRAPVKLADAYAALLGQIVHDPLSLGLGVARRGLLQRGVLERHETKVLKVIPSSELVVPPATADMMRDLEIAPVQALARTGGGIEPETWALVQAGLKRAILQCTKPQNTNN